jgi:hypothetical protein
MFARVCRVKVIAGQAKARELTLVTSNTTGFTRVSGLKVEDWARTTSPMASSAKASKARTKRRANSELDRRPREP